MQTLRHAAQLLTGATSRDGRIAIARALNFNGPVLPVDARTLVALRLPKSLASVDLVTGEGALRALLVDGSAEPSLRQACSNIALALQQTTEHALWLIVAVAADGAEVGVATWLRTARGQRVVALVAASDRIVASDAETLRALASSVQGTDLLVHAKWCELLGRETICRRFYRTLEERIRVLGDSLSGVGSDDRAELSLLYASRLLFLSFLETKGWLNGDHAFLANQFDGCIATGGRFHQRVLLPLFFGTLNTRMRHRAPAARSFGAIPFLNGGLFSRTATEQRHRHARFSDEAFAELFTQLLGRYRFTARESDDLWAEASVDPEMLGRAFEQLMASRERRASGAFYTPHELVTHLSTNALATALSDEVVPSVRMSELLHDATCTPAEAHHLLRRLHDFTVLDPACGSGAFLVDALERLSALMQKAGDTRDLSAIRREVLGRVIHGVDINPTAVWLCELRLWLSVVIESDETVMSRVPPLPNLDCNIRVGDALAGDGFDMLPALTGPPAALTRLHDRYLRATGPKKAPLRRMLAREERRRAIASVERELASVTEERRERVRARRAADLFGGRVRLSTPNGAAIRATRTRAGALRRELRRLRDGAALPFSFPSHFARVHSSGGFGLIIGNPPWVRIHNIPPKQRAVLKTRYSVFRRAAWEPGARSAGAAAGFSSQIDLASLFIERSTQLTRRGTIALLVPAKLWRSLAGGGVRRLLGTMSLTSIEDWSDAPACFDAAVYPSLLIANRAAGAVPVRAAVRLGDTTAEWVTKRDSLQFDHGDWASPLLLLPPAVHRSFNLLREHGAPLGMSALGRPLLGVKCGHNAAFSVNVIHLVGRTVTVEQLGRRGNIERQHVRPLLRGDAVTRWKVDRQSESIVWTHDASGQPLLSLPSALAEWLQPWKRQLANRSDLHSSRLWWSLFRTEGADSLQTRVVWSDFGRRPRAAVLRQGDDTVPLNTCYVVPCAEEADALALCAILNSSLAAAWLNAVAEPARGGWHRYLAWTVSLLPLPADWQRARRLLAPLSQLAMEGLPPSDAELLATTCEAYGVTSEQVEPLIAWCRIPSDG